MQKIEELRERLHHNFRPFNLQLSDGRSFHVAHPDFVALGRKGVVVITPDDISHVIDALHIVSVDGPAAADGE